MVEELKLAIKVDDDAIEQSLLKQFANAEKMANKVVLTFNNIDLDDKAIEAKFKEMQKMAGKNPIDLSIDKSSIEMLSAISKQLGNIFDMAKGKSIIDSSATSQIDKLQSKLDELTKKYDELSSKKIGSTVSGKDIDLVNNTEFKRLSDEFSLLKDELTGLKREMQLFEEATVSADTFVAMERNVNGLIVKVDDLIDKYVQLSVAQKNIGSDKSNISSGTQIEDVFQGDDKVNTDASTTAIKEESQALEQVSTSAKDAASSKEKFVKANKEVKESADSSKTSISEEEKYFNSLGKSLTQYQNTLTSISRKPADGNRSQELQEKIDIISSSIKKLNALKSKTEENGYIFNKNDVDTGKQLEETIKKNIELVKQMSAAQKGSDTLSRGKEIDTITKYLNKFTGISKQAKYELNGLLEQLQSGDPSVNVKKIHERFLELTVAERNAGREARNLFDIFKDKKIYSFLGQAASMFSFYDLINVGREGFQTIRELDTALTEMKKVSDETTQSLKNYQTTTFDVGDAVGATAKTIQDSTADWLRLGESINEAAESAKVSNILLNVSEFESIDEATESLVAMSQAYSELGKMDIIDVLNNIGNNYSIATDGLATALQKSASALKTANNDLNSAVALATAGNAVVQDPDSVGAGIRTISLRLVGTEAAKQELESIGEETDDVITTTSKLRDTILSATAAATNDGKGFDIFDSNGNYKSTYEIMQGLADLYDDIVAKDKELGTNNLNLLLETIAGKNRSNIAASILQNGEMLRSVYQDAQNSSGSAQKELDSYLDSIDGRMTQLENRAQEFWFKVIDSDTIKNGITLLTDFLELGTNIVDTFGVLPTVMAGVGAGLSIKNVGVAQLN